LKDAIAPARCVMCVCCGCSFLRVSQRKANDWSWWSSDGTCVITAHTYTRVHRRPRQRACLHAVTGRPDVYVHFHIATSI